MPAGRTPTYDKIDERIKARHACRVRGDRAISSLASSCFLPPSHDNDRDVARHREAIFDFFDMGRYFAPQAQKQAGEPRWAMKHIIPCHEAEGLQQLTRCGQGSLSISSSTTYHRGRIAYHYFHRSFNALILTRLFHRLRHFSSSLY